MISKGEPEALLSHLSRADGSATYAHAGYSVTASVNGPIEAQRRDEDPYEALVDVIVRPAAGVGGTRERHLESILQSSLRQLILVKNFPRGLVQIVLQVTSSPVNDYANTKLVQASLNLPIIPALLQAAVLALLSAAIPLRATATSTVVAVAAAESEEDPASRVMLVDPSPREAERARSLHVFTFTSGSRGDKLLLSESEGHFTMQEWADVYAKAKEICCGTSRGESDGGGDLTIAMALDDADRRDTDMRHFIWSTMEAKVSADLHWKNALETARDFLSLPAFYSCWMCVPWRMSMRKRRMNSGGDGQEELGGYGDDGERNQHDKTGMRRTQPEPAVSGKNCNSIGPSD